MTEPNTFRVIDVFAGPGGLSEGFSEYRERNHPPFDIALSIEKDEIACQTLTLRKFLRSLPNGPSAYTNYLTEKSGIAKLKSMFPEQNQDAEKRTWKAELGKERKNKVNNRIENALGEKGLPWVLIGGPPCQAYSLVGRSRMRGTPGFEADKRHFLYREYLKIVAQHQPAVFVMENVRGLLSSTHSGSGIFERIIKDLRRPAAALNMKDRIVEYRLYGLGTGGGKPFEDGDDPVEHFLLRAEEYGIPQARHRIFIIGVRNDIKQAPRPLDRTFQRVSVKEKIGHLPKLRSRITKVPDSWDAWRNNLMQICSEKWFKDETNPELDDIKTEIKNALQSMTEPLKIDCSPSGVANNSTTASLDKEQPHREIGLVTQHAARGHMPMDLHRYFFAAIYGKKRERSPSMKEFPKALRPKHNNVDLAVDGKMFSDRFRVQLEGDPSSTITSHISKDGHYFIHYDPTQCRSLTVREAAILQTFPEDYFFCGTRTQQYHQVGNAVPPKLAEKVAERVYEVISKL